ncbi:MAG: hypothetical protein WDZ28_02250 [Simkaniaceae bacterium]
MNKKFMITAFPLLLEMLDIKGAIISTFHGENGHAKNGIENKVGLPRMTQISIAPEIEYNLTETSGFLFGLWGTIAGRNAAAFSSFVFAYYQAF